jgi:phosphoribosylaminoimidazole-succinocarboxamide synthase
LWKWIDEPAGGGAQCDAAANTSPSAALAEMPLVRAGCPVHSILMPARGGHKRAALHQERFITTDEARADAVYYGEHVLHVPGAVRQARLLRGRTMTATVVETNLPGLSAKRGKVRDVYDLGDRLILVTTETTDRISAFDWVLPTPIPDKGRVLTQLSNFWFRKFGQPHHLLETDVRKMKLPAGVDLDALDGRTILVRKTQVVPIECVVRAYISGSAWKEYGQTGHVTGISLPSGLRESERLPAPMFTPATKAEQGEHDINITFAEMQTAVGAELAELLRQRSLDIYSRGAKHALERGIILADTKFEFGLVRKGPVRPWAGPPDPPPSANDILLIDEVLTPDSSRFWPADQFEPGKAQPSFDKQYVRDWLSAAGWDKNSPPPELPADVVEQTRAKYIEAYEQITGESFAWA